MRKSYFNIYLDIVREREALKSIYFDLVEEYSNIRDINESLNTNNILLSTRENMISKRLRKSCKTVFFVNAHCFNTAQVNSIYRDVLNDSDYIFNDGIGIKIGSYFAGVKIKDNLNGTDLIPQIIKMGVMENKNIYLVGSLSGIAERAKYNLEREYTNIHIVGTNNGFFSEKEEENIIADINKTNAEILIVGMGVPTQEIWIHKIRNRLKTVKICIAGGAIIDFLSGNISRAPIWMRQLRIEWIYRLYMEPQRMWKRYLIGNFLFFFNIGKQLIL